MKVTGTAVLFCLICSKVVYLGYRARTVGCNNEYVGCLVLIGDASGQRSQACRSNGKGSGENSKVPKCPRDGGRGVEVQFKSERMIVEAFVVFTLQYVL